MRTTPREHAECTLLHPKYPPCSSAREGVRTCLSTSPNQKLTSESKKLTSESDFGDNKGNCDELVGIDGRQTPVAEGDSDLVR